MMPMYTVIFQVFAYSNWCDITWGNREKSLDIGVKNKAKAEIEAKKAKEDLKVEFKLERFKLF